MLDTKAYNLREHIKPVAPSANRAERPITLEEELFPHITLGHFNPFWMDRQGIARVDLDKWKENKLPVSGINGIVNAITSAWKSLIIEFLKE